LGDYRSEEHALYFAIIVKFLPGLILSLLMRQSY